MDLDRGMHVNAGVCPRSGAEPHFAGCRLAFTATVAVLVTLVAVQGLASAGCGGKGGNSRPAAHATAGTGSQTGSSSALSSASLPNAPVSGGLTAGRSGSVRLGRFVFPRDHRPHADASIEWWYFSGILGSGPRRFATVFVAFRSRGLTLTLVNVLDLRDGRRVLDDEILLAGAADTRSLDLQTDGARLRLLADGSFSLSAAHGGVRLSLTARPRKPFVAHGDAGLIPQADVGRSFYYSDTHMQATGSLTAPVAAGGGRQTLPLSGELWMDHQWGDFLGRVPAFRFDWFSCRFSDGADLMLYRFVDDRGRQQPGTARGTFVTADGRASAVPSFVVTPESPQLVDAHTGRAYALRWRVAVPSLGIDVTLRALSRNQIMGGAWLWRFWEGAMSVTGTQRGYAFVEQSRP